MAAPIEQKISSAIQAASRHLKIDTTKFDVPALTAKEYGANVLELESVIEEIDLFLAGLCSAKDAIKEGIDEWTDLGRKATQAERPDLDQRFTAFSKKKEIPNVLEEADAALQNAKLQKGKLTKEWKKQKFELDKQNQAKAAANPHPVAPTGSTAAAKVKIDEIHHEALKIEKFRGAEGESWSEWWELYSSIHEDKKLTDERKFLYLRSYIPKDSTAGQLIAGFTPSEYRDAIDLLKENFGQDKKRIRTLQQQLFNMPVCTSLEEVRKMYLAIERICRQLKGLGQDTDGDHYFNALEGKLTRNMLRDILEAKNKAGDSWTTSDFRKELKTLVESEMEISAILKHAKGDESSKSEKKAKKEGQSPQAAQSPSVACPAVGNEAKANEGGSKQGKKQKKKWPCTFCGEQHWASDCKKFATVDARFQRLKEMSKCTRCCRPGHSPDNCQRPTKCAGCDGEHPLALCKKQKIPQMPKYLLEKGKGNGKNGKKGEQSKSPATGANATVLAETAQNVSASLTTSLQTKLPSFRYCMLRCREATLFNPLCPEKMATGTVFIDSGSQKNMISERFANLLGLKKEGSEEFKLRGVGPPKSANAYNADWVNIGMKTNEEPMEMALNVMPNDHLPAMITVAVDEEEAAFLDSNPLEAKYKIEAPDVLIGAKYYNELCIDRLRQLPSGFWLFSSKIGPMLDSEGHLGNITALVTQLPQLNSTLTEEEDELYERVKQFCQNDSLYLEKDEMTAEEVDKMVHEKFRAALKYDAEEKRYEIELPFKMEELEKLPTNYAIARSRLFSVLKQLNGNEKMMEKYRAKMKELMEKDMVEAAPREPDGPVHYLPHQFVWNEEKQKLRIVFDASSHSANALCLNDTLHQGPVLLKDLASILMRFRIPAIVVTADMEAAFLQLKVATKHRDVTRYLWPDDPTDLNSPIRTYRFKKLTFGLKCAPYAHESTVYAHLEKYEGNRTAFLIGENLYMDNTQMGVDHPGETLPMCREAKGILREAGYNLREFASNDLEAMRQLPIEDRLTGMNCGEKIKVLGIGWDTERDSIILKLPEPMKKDDPVTKRTVLSQTATPFDPLGLISPTLLPAKIFIQKLWEKEKVKNSWDKELEKNEKEEWRKIGSDWKKDSNLIIPRRLFSGDRKKKKFELHAFADASGIGLGIAVYLRAIEGKRAETRLLFARSKVIPKQPKKRTIPRLEMQATFMAAKIVKKIQIELHLPLEHVQLWSDSENLVKWLCQKEKQKDVYLNRRLEAISHWDVRFVRGTENPADIASRGLPSGEELAKMHSWFNGPIWMAKMEPEWPNSSEFNYLANEVRQSEEERIFYSICAATATKIERPVELFRARGISTSYLHCKNGKRHKTAWRRQKGAAAFVVRFLTMKLAKIKKPNAFLEKMRLVATKGLLTADELAFAEKIIIREAQKKFPAEDHLEMSLGGFFEDDDGILRVKGRLEHSELPESAKWPIFVPKHSTLAILLLEDSHAETMHGKSTAILRVRQHYWIPGIRQILGKVVRKCMKCRIFGLKAYPAPAAPPLPASRVVRAAAWQNIGVDYAGPFTVYQGQEAVKRYICLFNCQTTRAVHLEMATDASAIGFLKAFRRFCAMCRVPSIVISDNGTNFTASAKALAEIWAKVAADPSIQSHAATKGIRWIFVTERAPWRNGFTETLNRGIKQALRATFGRKKLNEEEFATILYELSAILNERPLTYLSSEAGEEILSPSRLIKLELTSSGVPPTFDLEDPLDPDYRPKKAPREEVVKAYEKAITKQDKFWDIWRTQYLVGLRERQQKDIKNGSDLKPAEGNVVIIEEENMPRNVWKLGRIEKLIEGEGGIRTAHLRVAGSERIWKRAINQIYPLELEGDELGMNGENLGESVGAFVLRENNTENIPSITAATMDDMELLDYDEETDEPMPEQETSKTEKLPKIRKFPEFQQNSDDRDSTGRLKSKVVVVKNKEEKDNRRFRPIARPRTFHNRAYRNVRFSISPIRRPSSPPNAQPEKLQKQKQDEVKNASKKQEKPKAQPDEDKMDHSRFREMAQKKAGSSKQEMPKNMKKAALAPTLSYPKEWQLAEICKAGIGEHRNCQPLRIDQMLGKHGKSFEMLKLPSFWQVTSLMEMLAVNWAFRNIDCSSIQVGERLNMLREFIQAVMRNPNEGLKLFEERKSQLKGASKIDGDWPLIEISWLLVVRKKHCRMAAEAFDKDFHKAVKPATIGQMPEANAELTTFLANRLARALTDLRATEFYDAKVVHSPNFLIGDEWAAEFGKKRMPICTAAPIPVNQLANLIPANYYLGNEVQNIIIWIGAEGFEGALNNALEKALATLEIYGKKVIVVTPPLIWDKNAEFSRIYKMMEVLCVKKGAVFLRPSFSKHEGCPKYMDQKGTINSAAMDLLEEELLIKGIFLEEKMSATQKKKLAKAANQEKPPIVDRLSIVQKDKPPIAQRISIDPRQKGNVAAAALGALASLPGTSAHQKMAMGAENNIWLWLATLIVFASVLLILGWHSMKKRKENFKKNGMPWTNPQNQSKMPKKRGKALRAFFGLMMALILLDLAFADFAFWCKDGDSQLWDLNAEIPCPKMAPSENWKNITIDVYEKIEAPMAIPAFRCEIRVDIVDFYMNWLGDKFPKRRQKQLKVEGEECLLMGRKKKCSHWEMKETEGGGWATKNPLEMDNPGVWNRLWMNTVSRNATNCYVHNTTVLADRKSWEVTIPGAVRAKRCWLMNNTCNLAGGGLVKWPEFMYVNRCQYVQIKANWTGEYQEDQQIFSSIEQDFVLSWKQTKFVKDCNGTVELAISDQGLAVPIWQWKLMQQNTRKRRGLASTAQMAGADTANSFAAIRALNRTIAALQNEECIRKRKEIADLPFIFAKNPMGAAKYLFNRTLLANWRAHGLLEVRECVKIPWAQIKWRKVEDCFQYFPINATLLGKPFEGFLNPITLMLSNSSPKGACSVFGIQYFRVGNGLLAIDQRTGKRHEEHLPIKKWRPKMNNWHPYLEPTIFHDVFHTPLEVFLSANTGEEIAREELIKREEKVEIEDKSKEEGQFSLAELGQEWKKFKEFWGNVGKIWSIICNIFVSAQIICFLLALLITKIRHDQWIWQRTLMGGHNDRRQRRKKPQLEEASSDASNSPSRRRIRSACRDCRGMEKPGLADEPKDAEQ